MLALPQKLGPSVGLWWNYVHHVVHVCWRCLSKRLVWRRGGEMELTIPPWILNLRGRVRQVVVTNSRNRVSCLFHGLFFVLVLSCVWYLYVFCVCFGVTEFKCCVVSVFWFCYFFFVVCCQAGSKHLFRCFRRCFRLFDVWFNSIVILKRNAF